MQITVGVIDEDVVWSIIRGSWEYIFQGGGALISKEEVGFFSIPLPWESIMEGNE